MRVAERLPDVELMAARGGAAFPVDPAQAAQDAAQHPEAARSHEAAPVADTPEVSAAVMLEVSLAAVTSAVAAVTSAAAADMAADTAKPYPANFGVNLPSSKARLHRQTGFLYCGEE
jgi:hypothetical protein